MPLLVVGDEIYKAKAAGKAVKLAEMLGMPVTQVRQLYANFPETHPLWVGNLAGSRPQLAQLPEECRRDHQCRQQVPAQRRRADRPARAEIHRHAHRHASMGNVMLTEVPLVATSAMGSTT